MSDRAIDLSSSTERHFVLMVSLPAAIFSHLKLSVVLRIGEAVCW